MVTAVAAAVDVSAWAGQRRASSDAAVWRKERRSGAPEGIRTPDLHIDSVVC